MNRRPTYLHTVCAGPRQGGCIPVEEVVYFRADDASTMVVTGKGEFRITTPLTELLALLDPEKFRQVHRSMVVNKDRIEKIKREDENHLVLTLKERRECLTVDKPYCWQFAEHAEKVNAAFRS